MKNTKILTLLTMAGISVISSQTLADYKVEETHESKPQRLVSSYQDLTTSMEENLEGVNGVCYNGSC